MNPSTAQQSWTQPPARGDSMAQMNDDLDDFGTLFEFNDLDLENISAVDSVSYGGALPTTHPGTPYNEITESHTIPSTAAQEFVSEARPVHHTFHTLTPSSGAYPPDPAYQSSMPQPYSHGMQYQFQGKPAFTPTSHVPPTPNSFEMHGQTGRFPPQAMDSQHRALLEQQQRYQLRKDDPIAFTPMASPAGTPQFNHPPEFTIPGAYFSPLTSPMLHAQNSQTSHHTPQHGFYTNPSTAPSSNPTSPLDPNTDVDMLLREDPSAPDTNVRARKSERRKAPTSRLVAGASLTRVKQSPVAKAQKRKSGTMLSSMASLSESESTVSHPSSTGLQMRTANHKDSPEDGSISPEPLSEALMGPPPRPGSGSTQSPALVGLKPGASPAGPLGKAATPKSLLSMRGPQSAAQQPGQSAGQNADGAPAFEDIQLPEAAANESTPRPSLSQINTQIPPSADETNPALASRKTPKLGPLSTPSSTRPTSSSLSPLTAITPLTASTPGALLKGGKMEQKGGRANKKRGSMSSTNSAMLSPALRPRISPSIKPLLPEGSTLNSQTHALLLASKSNYQNLLEGNHLPGVNYPDSLSTGLTSKRTSHKVAEQGRRNRINEALREMQSLLPKIPATPSSSGSAKQNGGKDSSHSDGSPDASTSLDATANAAAAAAAAAAAEKEESQAKSNSSKAATVESANDYIRKLQKENAALLRWKREHEALKRKMGMELDATPEISATEEGDEDGDGAPEDDSRSRLPADEARTPIVRDDDDGVAVESSSPGESAGSSAS